MTEDRTRTSRVLENSRGGSLISEEDRLAFSEHDSMVMINQACQTPTEITLPERATSKKARRQARDNYSKAAVRRLVTRKTTSMIESPCQRHALGF